MKQKNILWLLLAVFAVVVVYFSLSNTEPEIVYANNIEREREDKFRFMKYNEASPLSEAEKTRLTSLNYFEADKKYKVKARLSFPNRATVVSLPTSDDKSKKYRTYATARFTLADEEHELLVFETKDLEGDFILFIPFADETSALSTYGGGRYLEMPKRKGNTLTIDFNLAYNPDCAYNPETSCPLPPPENYLRIAIEAGEKNFPADY